MEPLILPRIKASVYRYRVHIVVFLVALFIGLTLAHPAVLLNDEFITTNQLHQLHAGHQVIINEGKYGVFENGSLDSYFQYKSNILGYSLFLPLLSLPANLIIDLFGEQCAYLIICLWTVVLLILILFVNHFFSKFSFIGRYQWTQYAIVVIFILFFLNLSFFETFPVDPVENFPEILAIVFTNIILLALSAMMMYEINRTIFEDPAFSFFGTIVCLFSSSYFLWVSYCKDHILVLLIITAIFLCLVRLVKTDDDWYLPLSFLLSGLLAWARPELALWLFLLICGICGYGLIYSRSRNRSGHDLLFILCSPLFTLIGALPFFLNNFLITKNVLLPPITLYFANTSTPLGMNATKSLIPVAGAKSTGSVIMQFVPTIPLNPLDLFTDLVGIFFYPENGSISIFALIPLFLVMAILACIFLLFKKIQFSSAERKFISISLLVSLPVFLAYASQIHLLNVDLGMAPDIRYLSPFYLPLTVTGLILLKKMNILSERPENSIYWLSVVCILGLVISLVLLPLAYGPSAFIDTVHIPIHKFFSIYALVICLITLGTIIICKLINKGVNLSKYLIFLLCSIPFFWQVNATFIFRSFSAFANYTFWIPIVRVIWELIVNFVLIKTVVL